MLFQCLICIITYKQQFTFVDVKLHMKLINELAL